MIDALAPIFIGPLADVADRLVLADDPRPSMPGSDLLDPAVLGPILERFAGRYDQPEPRAVASLWAKWHFWMLLTPVVAASLLLEHELPTGLDEVEVVLAPDGQTTAFKLQHGGSRAAPADGFERFGPLVDGHIDPVIRALAAQSGATAKVLWSNVGNLFENLLRQIEDSGMARGPGPAQARALMASRDWPGRRGNPLFEPVRYVERDGEQKRLRRVCCIRYLIPSLGLCSTCPLEKARPA
ncbi:siderophore-iron reductase FhuF [Inquilinus sp. CA228]|uniref:siderophore-iron reductase FhuF n=1 Tax=Inquilinus sp. CA228 TaxID=3455609 RepID=UPI003F8CFC88